MNTAKEYAAAFEAVARCALVAIMLLMALIAADMIATGAESASAARELGSDATAQMEARP